MDRKFLLIGTELSELQEGTTPLHLGTFCGSTGLCGPSLAIQYKDHFRV